MYWLTVSVSYPYPNRLMLKQHIIKHYLSSDDIIHIMPQHHGKVLGLMFKYTTMALIVWIIHSLVVSFMSFDQIAGRVAVSGLLIIVILFNYYFMMLYLDSIVITPLGIIIMDQLWLLDFSQVRFDRESIQTISYHQHGIVDRLLNKWDITIGIEHGTDYLLPNIVNPTKRVERLNNYKHQSVVEQARQIAMVQDDYQDSWPSDKFDLLVDKLSDIIVDYMQQPRRSEDIIDGDNSQEIIPTKPKDEYPGYYEEI